MSNDPLSFLFLLNICIRGQGLIAGTHTDLYRNTGGLDWVVIAEKESLFICEPDDFFIIAFRCLDHQASSELLINVVLNG